MTIGVSVVLVILVVVLVACVLVTWSRIYEYSKKFKGVDLVELEDWKGESSSSDEENCGKHRLDQIRMILMVSTIVSAILSFPAGYLLYVATKSAKLALAYMVLAVIVLVYFGVLYYYLGYSDDHATVPAWKDGEQVYVPVNHALVDFASFSLIGLLLHAVLGAVFVFQAYKSAPTTVKVSQSLRGTGMSTFTYEPSIHHPQFYQRA